MGIREERLQEMMALPMYQDFLNAGYTEAVRYPEVSREMLRSTVLEIGKPLSKTFSDNIDGEDTVKYIIEIALIDSGIMHNYNKIFSNFYFEAHVRLFTDYSRDRCQSMDIHFHAKSVEAIEERVYDLWVSLGGHYA